MKLKSNTLTNACALLVITGAMASTAMASPPALSTAVLRAEPVDILPGAPNLIALEIQAPKACYQLGDVLLVDVNITSLQTTIRGYQLLVAFDAAHLDYLPASSAYDNSVFSIHLLGAVPVLNPGGQGTDRIGVVGAIGIGSAPTDANQTVATLAFEVIASTDVSGLSIAFDNLNAVFQPILSDGDSLPVAPLNLDDSAIFQVDVTDPVITCPVDVAIECDESTDPSNTGTATATDDSGPPTITFSDGLLTDPCNGTIDRTWKATDAAGNSAECLQVITVVDSTAPTVILTPGPARQCPAVIVAECDGAGNFPELQAWLALFDADDNCTASPTLFPAVPGDVTLTDECGAKGTTGPVTFEAEDACGNVNDSCVSSFTINDTTPPSLFDCPDDVTVIADVGFCDAPVTLIAPTASDVCSATATVTGTRDDAQGLGANYGSGATVVTWEAEDDCSLTSTCQTTVTVQARNDLRVRVQLQDTNADLGVPLPVSRCISFTVKDALSICDMTTNAVGVFDNGGDSSVDAFYVFDIRVPCGDWATLCVKDAQHSLATTVPLTLNAGDNRWDADDAFLEGGDTDDSGAVDILDVTFFLAEFGTAAEAGGCPFDGVTRDADFNNDGFVFAGDDTILAENYLTGSGVCCPPSPAPGIGPEDLIPVVVRPWIGQDELPRVAEVFAGDGQVSAGQFIARVDLNADAMFDYRDVQHFEQLHGLDGRLSAAIRKVTQEKFADEYARALTALPAGDEPLLEAGRALRER